MTDRMSVNQVYSDDVRSILGAAGYEHFRVYTAKSPRGPRETRVEHAVEDAFIYLSDYLAGQAVQVHRHPATGTITVIWED